ncbi:hypothetical protein DYBT9275_03512 [Dyadobacter sp. CECT 9275]|uniref:Uncharacterized protein n=1 Tax=Dyadobacter helix TaxID=2822344 RepID=A0A916JE46_9BACT|nr:EboA domain-containing protein [Dyadobacter sp. CECT 9275]CAG5005097.1 hypothetical protein DYBT9275_03512 [Dyadobacter sp. CECT 9275]
MSSTIPKLLWELIEKNTTPQEADWLKEKGSAGAMELMTAFVAAPRFLAKKSIYTDLSDHSEIPGFSVHCWTLVRLARVWLLTQLDDSDQNAYIHNIETLFDTAEMNELVALYSALPVLSFPEKWLFRATDAVRSNMGLVFDAIALHNPYPEKYFTELAWNQLVLKTIFNDKPIHYIVGLKNRENPALAYTLSDFAHERWAAGRSVAPEVWRLVSSYMNEDLVSDMRRLFQSDQPSNQKAAALACHESGYVSALHLLAEYPEFEQLIASGELTWANLEITDLNTYVPQP